MARRWSSRRWWAVLAAVLVVVLGSGGLLLALRGDRAQPPGAAAPSTVPATPSGTPSGRPSPSSPASPSATTVPPPTTVPAPPPPTTGAAPLPAGLAGQDVTVLPTSRRVVALTFDAGANGAGLPSILRTLAEQHVPATFFLTGHWAAANPAQVSAIRSAGHRIGNHSATHPYFPQLSDAQIREQVLGAEQTIGNAGADPRPLFRFPFGDRNAHTIAVVNDLGYVAVRWTVDTLGWKGTSGGMSAAAVADRALGALQPGEIVLMHIGSNPDDGSTLDADALPGVLSRMRAAGYDFTTLDALLG